MGVAGARGAGRCRQGLRHRSCHFVVSCVAWPPMKRRRFLLLHTSAMTAAALAPSISAAAEDPRALIIDTHQHLWDPALINPPWLKSAPQIGGKHHLAEYAEATKDLNVRAVYMEVDVAEADLDAEARHVIGLCEDKTTHTLAATLGGRPDAASFADYVARHAASGKMRGVRQVLHGASTKPGHCLKEEFVAGIRLLGEKGLHFDLCMRPKELRDGVALAKRCPETRFVIDHCGNADVKAFHPRLASGSAPEHEVDDWKSAMEELATLPNTMCKISGIIARLPAGAAVETLAPIVNHCLDTFGPERVVFGGDWPVCLLGGTFRQWVDGLTEMLSQRPMNEQRALWSGNAVKFYRLEGLV